MLNEKNASPATGGHIFALRAVANTRVPGSGKMKDIEYIISTYVVGINPIKGINAPTCSESGMPYKIKILTEISGEMYSTDIHCLAEHACKNLHKTLCDLYNAMFPLRK
jgi:hypothetical protein